MPGTLLSTKAGRRGAGLATVLALALLCVSPQPATPTAAGRQGRPRSRGLQQPEAAPPPASGPKASAPPASAAPLSEKPLNTSSPAALPGCQVLVEGLVLNCAVSLDRIAMTGFTRGASQPPTAAEAAAAVRALAQGGLPPRKCCQAAANYSSSPCPCDPDVVAHLHEWLNEQSEVEYEFVQGALAIMDMAPACSIAVPLCLAIDGVHAQAGKP